MQDLKLSLRRLRREPRLTAIVVLCIGLAIGLCGTVFSIVNALLFRDLPVRDSARLVRVFQAGPGFPYASFSYPNYRDVRDRNQVFSGFVSGALRPVDVLTEDGSERVSCEIVTGNYFEVLGVEAQFGRLLQPADDLRPGAHPVAVISDGFWRERFGGRRDAVGSKLTINGEPFTVVGVAPRGFTGSLLLARPDVWAPMMMQARISPPDDLLESRGSGWMFLTTGRLKDGLTLEQARAGLELQAKQLAEDDPDSNEDLAFTLVPMRQTVITGSPTNQGAITGSSAVLLVMVGFVLLIACANVANLLLARAAARRRELAIRLAAGADRAHLFRQLLTESLVLALLGGLAGILLAAWSATLLPRLVPPIGIPIELDFSLDTRVVLFTLVVTLATAILFGLAPALRATRGDLTAALRGEAEGIDRRSRFGRRLTLSRILVAAQVALCVLLLVGAGLFARSLSRAQLIDPGFRTQGILLAQIDASLQGYTEKGVRELYRQILESLRAQPGVTAAAHADIVPLGITGSQQWGIAVEGYEPAQGERMNPDYNIVSPGYFETLGIALQRGRTFAESDDATAPKVVIVSEAMAKRYWSGSEALGGRISMGGETREVVGVVPDIKFRSLGQAPEPYLYLPAGQFYEPAIEIHMKTAGDPAALAGILRDEVRRLAPSLALTNVRTFEAHTAIALFPARMGAGFLSGFGLLALLLAAVGLYGVLNYTVSRRTREIGIRMALGAARRDVFALTLRDGLLLTLAGLVLGLAAALALSRLLASFLYGVSATDLPAFLVAVAVLLLVAVLACFLPARRAMRVDPWQAIRSE